MPLELFLRGLAIGFAVAFALGPIGLLVIKRTVDRGWLYGFLSGTGVATADATYGAIAAFGLTAITELLVGIDRGSGSSAARRSCSWRRRRCGTRGPRTPPRPARTPAGSRRRSAAGRRWSP